MPENLFFSPRHAAIWMWIKLIIHINGICSVWTSVSTGKFSVIHGPNTKSANPTLLYTVESSNFRCAAACVELSGCGGYNYLHVTSRHVECDLKSGTTLAAEVYSASGWAYYELQGAGGAPPTVRPVYPKDCQEVLDSGNSTSGVYQIDLDPAGPVPLLADVYCDMVTDGGGWLVLIRRQDGSEDFNRTWAPYRDGFGDLTGEFWAGLDTMYRVSSNGVRYQVRVDMTDFSGTSVYALYDDFNVTSAADNYTIAVGAYTGDAGDSLSSQNGAPFSTWDRPNDVAPYNCALMYNSGYWYKACGPSRLTGLYGNDTFDPVVGGNIYYQGIMWVHWLGVNGHPQYADMKIKPL